MVALTIGTAHKRSSSFLATAITGVMASATLLLLLAGGSSNSKSFVSASNPYSTNVVALTSANWKEVVLDSPHAVLINICRSGWGYCQRLQSDWEKLASSTKGLVTVAYWDTEGGSRPPRLLGEYKGTPTIRLFTPKKKQKKKGSTAEKIVLDYNHGERNVKDLKKFLEYQIPNFVDRIKFGVDDYLKIKQKANKYGLPMAVLFTSKTTSTSTSIKWLSTEYRRRMLLVEIPPVDKNSQLWRLIIGEDGDSDEDMILPGLYMIPPNDDDKSKIIKYEGDDYKRRKLQDFFNERALKEPVFEPINVVTDDNGTGGTATDNNASAKSLQEKYNDKKKEEENKKEKQESPGGNEL